MALVYQMNVHQNSGHITFISAFFRFEHEGTIKSHNRFQLVYACLKSAWTLQKTDRDSGNGYIRYSVKNRFFIIISIRGYIALSFGVILCVIFDE